MGSIKEGSLALEERLISKISTLKNLYNSKNNCWLSKIFYFFIFTFLPVNFPLLAIQWLMVSIFLNFGKIVVKLAPTKFYFFSFFSISKLPKPYFFFFRRTSWQIHWWILPQWKFFYDGNKRRRNRRRSILRRCRLFWFGFWILGSKYWRRFWNHKNQIFGKVH